MLYFDPGFYLTVVTPPTEDPITLAEAKAHLRVLHSSEDTLIGRLVKAATAHVESVTSRALITRTLKITRDAFPSRASDGMTLFMAPVGGITSITYLDTAGVEQTLSEADYTLAKSPASAAVFLKFGKTWPQALAQKRAVAITYTAGAAAAAASLPAALEDLRNAILLLTEHFYYHRSAVAEQPMTVVPMAVEALIGPHKCHGWI